MKRQLTGSELELTRELRLDFGAIVRGYFSYEESMELREVLSSAVTKFVHNGHVIRRQCLKPNSKPNNEQNYERYGVNRSSKRNNTTLHRQR